LIVTATLTLVVPVRAAAQAPSMHWHKEYLQERAGSVEIVRSDGRPVVVQFPLLPYSQKRYISSRSRKQFLRTVDRSSATSKREGMLAATLHFEVCLPAVECLPVVARGCHAVHGRYALVLMCALAPAERAISHVPSRQGPRRVRFRGQLD
jgi:hypothetical protein